MKGLAQIGAQFTKWQGLSKKYKLYSHLLDKEAEAKKLKKQKQLQEQEQHEKHLTFIKSLIPVSELKSQFHYTCNRCDAYILYDTLFIDDFTSKYIPLNEDMTNHKCR